MGRCYEFGVVIGAGCDHAMVVPAGGGRCECRSCGAVCTGRFDGCAAIVSQPGYVPVVAPAWAVEVSPAEPSALARAETGVEIVVPEGRHGDEGLGVLVERMDESLRRAGEPAARLEQLAAEVAARDEIIAEAFEAMNAAYRELAAELRSLADAQRALAEATGKIEAALEAALEGGTSGANGSNGSGRAGMAVLRSWRRRA